MKQSEATQQNYDLFFMNSGKIPYNRSASSKYLLHFKRFNFLLLL